MTPARRSDLAFRGAVVLLVAGFVGASVVRSVEPFGMDQGCFACFARWVSRGWLPYRDVFDSKAPLFIYSWALAAAMPGGDIRQAAWWFEAVWLAPTLGVAYLVTTRVWGRRAGIAAAGLLFVGLWSPAWGGFWSRAQSEELLAIPMLLSAWLAWRAIDHAPQALWAGVLAGICGLFKIPSMAIVLAWAVTWVACVELRGAAGRVARLAVGVAVPWALAFAWFGAHHATKDFVDAVFVYQSYHARFIAPSWGSVLTGFSSTMVMHGTLLLVAGAIGLFRLIRRGAREAHWVAAWILTTLAAIVMQRQLASYHYLLAMPALAVAGGFGVADLTRSVAAPSERRAFAGAGLLALVVLAGGESLAWWHDYAPDAAYLAGKLSREEFLRGFHPAGYEATEEDAAHYLREHSSAGDSLLVWGLSPGIYALADRPPATRYVFHKLLVTDAPVSRMWPGLDGRRVRFMETLRAAAPLYILVARNDPNGFEPLDSYTSMMRFRDLHDFISADYHLETQLGRFLVFRRGAALP